MNTSTITRLVQGTGDPGRCPHGRFTRACPVCAQSPRPVSMLPAALNLSSHGLAIFPLVAGGKTPLTAHGFKDATTDPVIIGEWWSQWPSANIGLPTKGIVALDVDVKNGHRGDETLAKLESQHGKLPETIRQRTWSGGLHYLFLAEDGVRNSAGALGPGLDVRGEGGYIVAAPSVIDGHAYEWVVPPGGAVSFARMPAWLIEMATKVAPAPALPHADSTRIREGQRNITLYRFGRSMAAKGTPLKAITAALLAMNADFDPPMPETDVRKTAEHCVAEGHRSDFRREGRIETPPSTPKELPVGRTVTALDNTPIVCLVEGLVPEGMFGLLSGQDSMGKTLLAMEVAKSVLLGEKLFGEFPTRQGTVMAVFLDDPENLTRDRLVSMGLGNVAGLTLFTQNDFDMARPMEVIATIEALALRDKPDLLIVDALYKFIPAGGISDRGNSASSMGPVMAAFNRISEMSKVTTMLLAHDGKSGMDVVGSYVVRAEPKFILRLALPPGARESRDGEDRLTPERVFELNKLKITAKASWRLRLDGPGQWVLHGSARDAKLSELGDHVLVYLEEAGEAKTVDEIASALHKRAFDVRQTCVRLWNEDRLMRETAEAARGQVSIQYRLPHRPTAA